jgi:hypothetical protein
VLRRPLKCPKSLARQNPATISSQIYSHSVQPTIIAIFVQSVGELLMPVLSSRVRWLKCIVQNISERGPLSA